MKNRLALLFIVIFGLFFYALTLRGIYGNIKSSEIKNNLDQATKPFELSPERGRFLLTMSLAENKSFALSQQLADAAYPDVGYKDGKFYIFFVPGISVLALPFYIVGKGFNLDQVFSYSMISFFAVLNLVFLYLISRKIFKLPILLSILVSFIFGFASTSWSYAITLSQHHVTTFFILSAFYAAWRYKNTQRLSWLYSLYVWFAYGASIFLDYPNVVLLAPIMLYHFFTAFQIEKLKTKTKINFRLPYLITSIIFFLLLALHGYYNYANFGSPTKLSGSLVGYKTIKEQKLLQDTQGTAKIKNIAEEKTIQGFFQEDQFPQGLSILTGSLDRGLLLYSPLFALSIIGIFLALRKITLESGILISAVLVNFFLYSSWGDPWGGWAFGPRYLIPSMAILAIFCAAWLNNTKYKIISRIAAFILFMYSSAVALLGAITTSQVPPKIEADYLHTKYNFLLNYDYFRDGRSGSFIFNEYASNYVSLQQYFLIIWGTLLLIVFLLLFIPLFFAKKNES